MGKRKLVAMQAEIDNLQSQVENLSNIVAGLSQDHIPAPRILDQSIFDHEFTNSRFNYAALNESGRTVFFESMPEIHPSINIWRVMGNLDGWISTKDRLPTHHQDVIVYRYNEDEGGNIEHSLYLDGELMKGFGNVADGEEFFHDVYYWQPIETGSLYEAMHMQLQIGEVGI